MHKHSSNVDNYFLFHMIHTNEYHDGLEQQMLTSRHVISDSARTSSPVVLFACVFCAVSQVCVCGTGAASDSQLDPSLTCRAFDESSLLPLPLSPHPEP